MAATGELALIAELGVAFAGFLAIFLIFARREGRFSPPDSLRVRSILISSFFAVFFALLPLALSLYGMRTHTLWRIASGAGLFIGVLAGLAIARRQLALTPEERATVGNLHTIVAWGLVFLAAVLFAGNTLGMFGEPAAAPYVTALICSLGVATSNFVTIAFQRLL